MVVAREQISLILAPEGTPFGRSEIVSQNRVPLDAGDLTRTADGVICAP